MCMKIRSVFTKITNTIKKSRYPESAKKEIRELSQDLKDYGYGNIEVQAINRNLAKVKGRKGSKTISVDMDFANRTQTQTEHSRSLALLMDGMFPYRELTQTVRGTMDGTAKRARTVLKMSNNDGSYIETTELENFVSGNHFKREKYVNENGQLIGTKYYQNIDGDFVRLFKQ